MTKKQLAKEIRQTHLEYGQAPANKKITSLSDDYIIENNSINHLFPEERKASDDLLKKIIACSSSSDDFFDYLEGVTKAKRIVLEAFSIAFDNLNRGKKYNSRLNTENGALEFYWE